MLFSFDTTKHNITIVVLVVVDVGDFVAAVVHLEFFCMIRRGAMMRI
jgi:hypothetical protein